MLAHSGSIPNSIPVSLLTGFLGSGKTTLLRRVLTNPAFSDTAVVINEVGEIAIDHYLVDFVEGSVIELPGGCLCCAVREDLAQTLRGLVERRDSGEIRAFRRIVVETSGLADPAPILYTLGADPMLDHRLRLARVVAVVDAVAGEATLARFAEAARQVAVADVVVISKTDLAPLELPLAARLEALNPAAARVVGGAACDPAAALCASHALPAAEGGAHRAAMGGWRPQTPPEAMHSHGIATFALALNEPVTPLDFARALGGLAMARGADLLRVKGLVAFADRPNPAVIQAAQHAMSAPEWLDDWPDDDHRSRLVFIVQDIAPEEILDRFAFAAPSLIAASAAHRHY